VRTVVASLLGGIVGMLVFGAVGGEVVLPLTDLEGLATLLPVLWSGIGGAILGACGGLAIAFRDEPPRNRVVTVLAVLVPAGLLVAGALLDVVDVMVVHPLVLVVLLPALALLGRSIAIRDRGRDDRG
jgi:hypothetical protein